MWVDNVSEIDILNYQPYCDVLMDILYDPYIDNTTIGLYGNWGSGKSTILNFLLKNMDKSRYGCININAWTFEGYEDIKKALIKTIVEEIENNTSLYKVQINKINELKKRTDFLKVGVNILPELASLILNLTLGYFVSATNIFTILKNKILNKNMKVDIDNLKKELIKEVEDEDNKLKNIRLFRKSFEEIMEQSKLEKLLIIIDDLDRCTPEKIIECLEAIKLFLSVKKVIFLIAVDDRIVEYAIKAKFPNINEPYNIQKDYLNKIIQIPIYIHQLVEEDISNYLMHLIVQKHVEDKKFIEIINNSIYREIYNKDISAQIYLIINFFNNYEIIYKECSTKELLQQDLYAISEIRGVISGSLSGSPRETKKFLNAFFIRKKLLQLYFVSDIDLSILAKLMALEIIDKKLYNELNEWTFQYPDTIKPLKEIILLLDNNEDITERFNGWKNVKVLEWLKMSPKDLYNKNLGKYFYLSRDYSIKAEDKTLICKDCGKEFVFTTGEMAFYIEKGFTNEPNCCPECRRLRNGLRKNNNY